MKKKFALAGIGYIAFKHLEAIQKVGGELIAAIDIRDSVGILDRYFPDCKFFMDQLRFAEYIKKEKVNYLTICTPNYLHLDYMEMAYHLGVKAICEKPMVEDLNRLVMVPKDANVILQMREDIAIINQLKKIEGNINIDYRTPRGDWYDKSWKGNDSLSGGLLTNIGIHLFDLAIYCFGKYSDPEIQYYNGKTAEGRFKAGDRTVNWRLTIEGKVVKRTINNIVIGSNPNLHIESYRSILQNRGWHKQDIKAAMELINDYRRIIKDL